MATKRTATTELTHENWNDDTPSEEAGQFQVASKEELSRRVVKKAKRRLDSDSPSSSPFAGFSGFNAIQSSTPKASFDFLKPTVPLQTEKSDGKTKESNGLPFTFTANSTTSNGSNDTPPPPPKLNISTFTDTPKISLESGRLTSGIKSPVSSSRSDYLKELRALNESVVAWIKQHVDKNPFCVLTPIFHDYGKYLQELDEKYLEVKEVERAKAKLLLSNQSDTVKTSFTSFKFNPVTDSRQGSTPVESRTKEDDDEYQPPKNEVQEVKEEGAVYTKRCKLYYKKDKNFMDKGVGTLYLKPNNDKTQLLIRAETNLGNILLNINLSSSMPFTRLQNGVCLACIPNPPLDAKNVPEEPQAVSFLIRVKGETDAEELLQKLNELKGGLASK